MLHYEEIESPRHFVEWGEPVIPDQELICGFAARDDAGELAALFVAYPNGGRWWAAFTRNERCVWTVHWEVDDALRTLAKTLVDAGEDGSIWALCDETKPRARAWMEYLGFRPANETEWVRRAH